MESFIESSYQDPEVYGSSTFKPYIQPVPLFSTTQVHIDYIDCVRWVGNCIISKSTKNRVALWAPDSLRYKVKLLINSSLL